MKFRSYSKGSLVAEDDGSGNLLIRAKHLGGIIRGRDVVIERADVDDLVDIMQCIGEGWTAEQCEQAGVTVGGPS